MIITREAKIYPSKTQLFELENLLEQSRQLYNFCLEKKIKAYKEENKTISLFQLGNETKEWGNMPASLRQATIYRLHKAYERFFKRGGFPRFKSKNRFRSIILRQYKTDYRISNNKKYLIVWKKYKLGWIRIRGLQELNNPKQARLVKRVSGWYLQVADEIKESKPKIVNKAVGIDLGLKYFLVDTDGNKVLPPNYFRKTQKKLAIIQRQLNKKKKGSKNRERTRIVLAKLYEKISNQRKDFLHKLSYKYANNYDLICLENLNIKAMMKNRHLSKSIADASWGIFTNMLSYKLKMLGKYLVKITPRNTTQKCSNCGELIPKSLSIRTHICTNCGYVADRDENASRNILNLGWDTAIGEGIPMGNPMNHKASLF